MKDIFAKRPFEDGVELIDWPNERTWVADALITLICSNDKEYWEKNKGREKLAADDPARRLRVECKIDGVPVRLTHLIERLGEEYERYVKAAAVSMSRERFGKIEDFLHRLERSIKDEFPELKTEDEY
jgi:hypothetical protein